MDPALLRNTSHRMEYIRILYYVYTMYIPSIYIIYLQIILYIYQVYTMYILSMCYIYIQVYIYSWYIQVYTKSKPYSVYHEYSWYITGISEPDRYMHGMYFVFTWYISLLCRPHQYVRYIPSSYFMGLFRTFFIIISLWYTLYILVIYYVYHKDTIKKKEWNKPKRYRLGIYQTY